ncbi:hypothetical protein F0562_023924 [Nyssa sinensis]|uniref:Uncharacterized protein n=1 Tax=Nyssa sinensis TaxID=561372 RepID=A0A5J5BM26_9ASTE|nr:hypothetical protein F0562_023924 [Nyssa sinensis]
MQEGQKGLQKWNFRARERGETCRSSRSKQQQKKHEGKSWWDLVQIDELDSLEGIDYSSRIGSVVELSDWEDEVGMVILELRVEELDKIVDDEVNRHKIDHSRAEVVELAIFLASEKNVRTTFEEGANMKDMAGRHQPKVLTSRVGGRGAEVGELASIEGVQGFEGRFFSLVEEILQNNGQGEMVVQLNRLSNEETFARKLHRALKILEFTVNYDGKKSDVEAEKWKEIDSRCDPMK